MKQHDIELRRPPRRKTITDSNQGGSSLGLNYWDDITEANEFIIERPRVQKKKNEDVHLHHIVSRAEFASPPKGRSARTLQSPTRSTRIFQFRNRSFSPAALQEMKAKRQLTKRHHICDRGIDLQRRHAMDLLSSRVHFLPQRNDVTISKTARLPGLRNPAIDLHCYLPSRRLNHVNPLQLPSTTSYVYRTPTR